MPRFLTVKAVALVGVLLALAACATPEGARTGLRALDEQSGLIQFDQATFDQGAEQRVVYATTMERDEYALYRSADWQAEFIYITTRHLLWDNVVVDRKFNLDGALGGFRHNQSEEPVSGEPFRLTSKNIRYWAKSYLLPKAGKSCGVFSGSWDHPYDEIRPSKALFGYFCQSGSTPLSNKTIEQMVGNVGIRGITADFLDGPVGVPSLDLQQESQTELLARAQGQAGDDHGNTQFPFKAVRIYTRSDNCHWPEGCS